MRYRLIVGMAVVAAALAVPSAARADGPPIGGVVEGGSGVVSFGGEHRFVTLVAGGSTSIAMIDTATGTIQASRALEGFWGIPQITQNGDTGGVSLDGRVLVVAQWPTFVHHHAFTRFAVLATGGRRGMWIRRHLTVPGWVGFDALSPDGRRMYVTQAPANDPLKYRVRTVDLSSGRILPGQIVDPKEPDEKMQGYAMSRTWSADGLTAYTLYSEPSGGAFIHALHTDSATADCIDLPGWAAGAGPATLRLSADGRSLDVLAASNSVIATVDPASREASLPAAAKPSLPAPPPPAPADDGGTSIPVMPVAAGFAGLALAGLLGLVALRRRAGASA